MKTARFALPLLALMPVGLALYGCGKSGQTAEAGQSGQTAQSGTNGHPSEADGRKVYEYKLSHGFFATHKAHVLSFHQTNGQNAEIIGVKVYNMDFEAETQYEPSPYANTSPGMKPVGPEIKKEKGTVSFEQTEKGWKAEDGNVY